MRFTVMKTRNYNIVELGKQAAVKTSNTLRLILEGSNVGAMTFASYVGNSFDGRFIAESLQGTKEKLSFEKDESVILCKGNGGSVVRMAQVSTCGKYVLRNGKIAALGAFGNFALENKGDVQTFVAALCNGEVNAKDHSFRVNKGGTVFHGIGFSTFSDTWQAMAYGYAALASVVNKKLVFLDMESKRNAYNGAVLGVNLSDETTRKAGADLVREFVGTKASKADAAKLAKATGTKKAAGKGKK